jgi:hypothetical protein
MLCPSTMSTRGFMGRISFANLSDPETCATEPPLFQAVNIPGVCFRSPVREERIQQSVLARDSLGSGKNAVIPKAFRCRLGEEHDEQSQFDSGRLCRRSRL